MEKETDKDQADIEWETRTLCRDENCIGVIGPDGRCKECGLPYNADAAPPEQQQAIDEVTTEADKTDFQEANTADSASDPVGDEDWQNRTLCSDGNCIGVIGPDGKCKECGKPFLFSQSD